MRLTSSSIWERLALTWVSRRWASDCTFEAAFSAALICQHTLQSAVVQAPREPLSSPQGFCGHHYPRSTWETLVANLVWLWKK